MRSSGPTSEALTCSDIRNTFKYTAVIIEMTAVLFVNYRFVIQSFRWTGHM